MPFQRPSPISSPLSSIPTSPVSSVLSSPPASPTIPPGWRDFTPPPSQDSGDAMPPARKRRKIEPRVRTTQHLDLTSDTAQSEYDRTEALDSLLKAIRKRRKIVVIAGAGISVSAGIPDFRSSDGLFRSLRGDHKLKSSGKALFDASVYKDDLSTSNFHEMVRKLSKLANKAKPTLFHRLLARLSTEGRLLRLYTQNVDGLETSMPPLATQIPLNHKAPWPQTIQLHGGLEKMMCQKCRHISNFRASLFDGPTPPLCQECVAKDTLRTSHAGKRSHGIGRLRPRIVLYNEHNPDDEAIGAVTTADFRTRPDCVIVVGTSMKIPAVRRIVHEMCKIVRDRREGTTIWINRDPVPPGKDLENCWDLVVRGESDEVARLAALKEWNDTNADMVEDCTDSELERVRSKQSKLAVILPSPTPKSTLPVQILLPKSRPVMTPPVSHDGDLSGRPSPAKSKKSAKGSPLKIRLITKETNSAQRVKNPASHGRTISDVLGGKENKARGPAKSKNAATKRGPGRPPKSKVQLATKGQAKITGRVTKSRPLQMATIKKHILEPLSPRRDLNETVVAQNQPSEYSSVDGSPAPETPVGEPSNTPSSWRNCETISPKGNVPRDMIRLLN